MDKARSDWLIPMFHLGVGQEEFFLRHLQRLFEEEHHSILQSNFQFQGMFGLKITFALDQCFYEIARIQVETPEFGGQDPDQIVV